MNERRERIKQVRLSELERGVKGLWWLSFADPERLVEFSFLGVVILEAYGFGDALNISFATGLNPGGEVQGFQVDPSDIPEGLRNRLLKKPDLVGFGVSTRAQG